MEAGNGSRAPGAEGGDRAGKRTILALGWVSFCMDISSEMIYPLLPVFLSSVLGAGGAAIGLLAGLSESTASFFRVASGVLSDRLRRRKAAVIAGYGVSALARPLLALSSSWGQVLAFRLVDRAGKGIRTPPRDALIADLSPPERYGRSFGIQRAMDTAGAVTGPALATLFLAWGLGYRPIFWLSIIPAIAAVAIIRIFVRERAPAREAPGAVSADAPCPAVSTAAASRAAVPKAPFPRELTLFLVVTAVFSLGNSSSFFLVLRAKDLGVPESIIPALYLTMNAVYSLVSYPAGRLADRFGKARVAFAGYLLYAAVYASFAAVHGASSLWILFPLQGLYLGFTDGVGTAYLATLLPAARRATGFAAYHTVIGFCLLPASAIGGLLWDRWSPVATFAAGASLSLVAGALFGAFLLRPGHRRNGVAAGAAVS